MIKLIKSTFYKEENTKKALIQFISSAKKLSFGQECEKFERNFARYQERKYCIFFNSGSSANLALIQALLNLERFQKDDKIGFSAVTWSTNIMPLIQLGLRPVPIDIELDTLNISSQTLQKVLQTISLKALFITNLLGFCDDIDAIKKICDEKNIILIEDNCESLSTVYKGRKLGNFGLASTFSFFVGHHLSTIEGGAVCTDDGELAEMLKLVRAHGWDRNLNNYQKKLLRKKFGIHSDFYESYTFYDLGYNFRPTEINGFIGNYQLKYIDEILQKRNANFIKLAPILYKKTKQYYPIKFDHIDFVSNFAVPLICKTEDFQGKLRKKCKNKIEIRPIVAGDLTQQPFFRKYMPFCANNFVYPNSQIVYKQGLYFGNNPDLTEEEIKEIIYVFTEK